MAIAFRPEPVVALDLYEGQLLVGTPISPSIAAGHARVLTTPDAGYVEPGTIVVVPLLSAEWMPLQVAGAAVAGRAHLLSDPAIVAREMGVPVVANIALATEAIRDGQTIVVDGGHGTVLTAP